MSLGSLYIRRYLVTVSHIIYVRQQQQQQQHAAAAATTAIQTNAARIRMCRGIK